MRVEVEKDQTAKFRGLLAPQHSTLDFAVNVADAAAASSNSAYELLMVPQPLP